MSHIIDRLKKLEKTVMSKPELPNVPRFHTSRLIFYSARKSGVKLILILLAIIAFGIIGYIAGIRSQRGGAGRSEERRDIAAVAAPKEQPLSVSERHQTLAEVMTEDLHTTAEVTIEDLHATAQVMTEDLHTAVSEEEKTVPFVPPLVRKDAEILASEDQPVAEQRHLVLERSGKSGGTGGYDEVAALAAAIIKATDEPITRQEEILNKKTILKLNVLGVVEEDDGMVAIISGESYKEGDKICQFTIEEITNDYVILSFKKKLYRKLLD